MLAHLWPVVSRKPDYPVHSMTPAVHSYLMVLLEVVSGWRKLSRDALDTLPAWLRHPRTWFGLWLVLCVFCAPWWTLGAWYRLAGVWAAGIALAVGWYERACKPDGTPALDRGWSLSLALGLGLFCAAVWPFAPRLGLESSVLDASGNEIAKKVTLPGFRPSEWLDIALARAPVTDTSVTHPSGADNPAIGGPVILEQSGWLQVTTDSTLTLSVPAPPAKAELRLDGDIVGRIERESSDRLEVLPVAGRSAAYRFSLRVESEGPVPRVGLNLSREAGSAPYDARFHFSPGPIRGGGPVMVYSIRVLLGVLSVLAAVLALAAMGLRTGRASPSHGPVPVWQTCLIIAVTLLVATGFRAVCLQRSGGVLDADEAAFGIMAERLLEGELPPLYHYGQVYQGTLEAWTLALTFHWAGISAAVLKWHAFAWYLAGVVPLLWLAAKALRLGALSMLGAYLAVSPQLLSWISTKGWFGYTSTWAMGIGILYLGYSIARESSGRSWRWIGLGVLSGLSFYVLPLVVPFTIAAGALVLRMAWRTLLGRAGAYLLGGAVLGLTPMILFDLATGGSATIFATVGRELGPARFIGERAFLDRFLGECFPVLLGTRPVHEDLVEHVPMMLAWIVYTLAALGSCLSLPRFWCDAKRFVRGEEATVPFLFALLACVSILVGVSGPFGIWPWYFLAVYPLVPFVLYEGIRFVGRRAPVAVPLLVFCVFFVNAHGTLTVAESMHHPTSLIKDGLLPAGDHRALLHELAARDIHAVICDQGMDIAKDGGRDWLGERLTFESRGDANGIDVFSRRHSHLAARLHDTPRVAYLFHKDFIWWDASTVSHGEAMPLPMTFARLCRLFGPEFADYERIDVDPYVLFTPRVGSLAELKPFVVPRVSPGFFPERILDGEIGSRALGPSYWASGRGAGEDGQQVGDWVQFDLRERRPVKGLVLYHGIKASDRSGAARVEVSQDGENWFAAGPLEWFADPNASRWRAQQPVEVRYIRAILEENRPNWWTIYEAWIL